MRRRAWWWIAVGIAAVLFIVSSHFDYVLNTRIYIVNNRLSRVNTDLSERIALVDHDATEQARMLSEQHTNDVEALRQALAALSKRLDRALGSPTFGE